MDTERIVREPGQVGYFKRYISDLVLCDATNVLHRVCHSREST